MIFPAVETLTRAKLFLFLEQLPDWHLGTTTRHTVRAFRAPGSG